MRQQQSFSYSAVNSTDIQGILLLDKPSGCSSQQAVSQIKRLLNTKKAGHTGTLDPLATGLLPICIGEATKFAKFLFSADKHYRVEVQLGICTDTGDKEGKVISKRSVPPINKNLLLNILAQFQGEINQIPPMFSAIKYKGKPLYEWARQGKEIERLPRPVTIYALQLLDYNMEQLTLEVRCSKGTYVRSLVIDIGDQLGCGAHITALRRLSVGNYHIHDSTTLEAIEAYPSMEARNQLILPTEKALPMEWPRFNVSDAAAFYLRRGQPLLLPRAPATDWIRLFLKSNNQLLGIGRILKDGRIAPERLLNG
jgi:tRNA pseudouridine55 synthase